MPSVFNNYWLCPSEALTYLRREVQFFPADLHFRWDNCTVKTQKLSQLGEFYFKVKHPDSNEQLLFNLKIFHLSKNLRTTRQATKYFDMKQI